MYPSITRLMVGCVAKMKNRQCRQVDSGPIRFSQILDNIQMIVSIMTYQKKLIFVPARQSHHYFLLNQGQSNGLEDAE